MNFMLSRVFSCSLLGIEAKDVEIEVDVSSTGMPYYAIVGLPQPAVKESKDRVKAAIINSNYHYPLDGKIIINLAPADVKKEGSAFDLPIAMGILCSNRYVNADNLKNYYVLGELSLDGSIKPIRGALSIASHIKETERKKLILPFENASEAALVEGIFVYGVKSLAEAVNLVNGTAEISPVKVNLETLFNSASEYFVDFMDVKGQEHVKRALEVAVAGGHNVLMIGPPGSGKSMLAKRIPTIMPLMTFEEAIETTKIHSIAGLLNSREAIVARRPFRSPHHTISDVGLVGGGSYPMPGEISLAHNGVLFLDEFPEFQRSALEVLRQPLEDGKVTISRALITITYPAKIQLIASMNPCVCGNLGHPTKRCTCSPAQIQRYISRISGPLLDRIDLHIEVPPVEYSKLADTRSGEPSSAIRARVQSARKIQQERFKKSKIFCNAHMESRHLNLYCQLDQPSQKLLENAMEKLGLSARAYDRIRKVARTIADLENSEDILPHHIAEAIQYRSLDRQFWIR